MKKYQKGYFNLDLGPGWVWALFGIFGVIGICVTLYEIVSWILNHIKIVW